MRRFLAVAVAVVASPLAGCRAPTPSLNMLAPYGSPTVPAPATGTVGTSGDYYSPPTPPAAGDEVGSAQPQTPGAFIGSGNVSNSTTDSAVVPASYTSGTTVGSFGGSASTSSELKLNGMRVNDATSTVSQPSSQGEPVNLTQLPDASQAPSFLRILTHNSASTAGTVTSAASATATTSSSNWQKR